MGLDYIYVDHGNDVAELIQAFESVKDSKKAVVVHINTLKGKGYAPAEQHKEQWHFNGPFHIETGKPLYEMEEEDYSDVTCNYLMKKMKEDPAVVAITSGTPTVLGFTEDKRKEAGRQFVDVGIAEETAVALAAALHADACEIYTDVDGVYTADPRKVPGARKLKEITYDEMLDLATLGAGVLHNRSVEMAKKYGVPLVVRSSLNDSEGTVVKEVTTVERMLISGVALDTDAVRIAVIGIKDMPGMAFKVFDTLAKKKINVDVILQSIGRAGTKDISFTVNKDDLEDAVATLEENQARLGYKELHSERNIAKLSIVGAGMMSNPGVAAKMFESLYNEGVNINMISTSEIRVTVLINEKDGIRAMNAVHDAFGLTD